MSSASSERIIISRSISKIKPLDVLLQSLQSVGSPNCTKSFNIGRNTEGTNEDGMMKSLQSLKSAQFKQKTE